MMFHNANTNHTCYCMNAVAIKSTLKTNSSVVSMDVESIASEEKLQAAIDEFRASLGEIKTQAKKKGVFVACGGRIALTLFRCMELILFLHTLISFCVQTTCNLVEHWFAFCIGRLVLVNLVGRSNPG